MAITNSEQGTITEAEFVKVVMLTSDGRAVPTRPVVDDEHRDFDIHLRRRLAALAVQLKTTLRLRKHGRQSMMQITFRLRPPLFTNSRYWYFFAHFDPKTMRFTEPVFLVPSSFVHRHARRGRRTRNGAISFQIKASLGPDAHDKWTPFRLTLAELGPQIVEILRHQSREQLLARGDIKSIDGGIVIVLGARRRSRQAQLKRAA